MRLALIPLLLLSALSVVGCQPHADASADLDRIRDTVVLYDELLAEGYTSMDMSPLTGVATEAHVQELYHHMAALGGAGIRMEPELLELRFENVDSCGEGLAKVETTEAWRYVHVNTSDEMPAYTVVENQTYELSYDLTKYNDTWLVSSVTVLDENSGTP